MHVRTASLILVLLGACGGGDDGSPTIDGPRAIDAPTNQPDASAACAMYCAAITTNCTGANLQFGNATDCLNTCATWPPGNPGEAAGQSVACRTTHANRAATDPAGECLTAGPSGNDVCGAPCASLCGILDVYCQGALQVYPDNATCQSTCITWATDPPYNGHAVNIDSYGCRLYHATKASTDPPAHCSHTADVTAACQ